MGWRVAVALVLSVTGAVGGAGAAPFALVSDGRDGVWVLDAAGGAVSWCRLVAPAGPKMIDVFGPGDSDVRAAEPRTARPACTLAMPGEGGPDEATLAALLAGAAGQVGDGQAGDGNWSWPGWLPDARIVGGRAGRGDVGGGSDRGDVDAIRPGRFP